MYEVNIVASAEKDLDRLPGSISSRISRRILSLKSNPRPRGVKKLINRKLFRIRVGDYRILFEINDSQHMVTVIAIGHRREVYD